MSQIKRKSSDKRKEKQPVDDSSSAEPSSPVRILWDQRSDSEALPIPIDWHDVSIKTLTTGSAYKRRPLVEDWDSYDSLLYNGLLTVKILPTQFVCSTTLEKMGFQDQIADMLRRVGLGTMATKHYPLYPELVRQFLASCQLHFKNERFKVASEGELTFKLNGVFYAVTFGDICRIFGFDATKEQVQLPSTFPLANHLWIEIARSVYNSSKSLQTEIKHPVLRVFVKIIASTILCKEEMSRMRVQELYFLHFAVGHLIDYGCEFPATHDINLGAVFARQLVECKSKGINGTEKETIGSLLTPIFRFVGIQLAAGRKDKARGSLDESYFLHCRILSKGWRYNFQSSGGSIRQI